MATVYTCFDGDSDIKYYRIMQAWHSNVNVDFKFVNAHDITQARDTSSEETIKRSLRTRLNGSDVLLVLVGESTRNLYKFVRWEIEVAIEKGMPIIVANLNKKKSMDYNLCPPIIRDELAIHIPFGQKIISFAITNWPNWSKKHKADGKTGAFYYEEKVYNSLEA